MPHNFNVHPARIVHVEIIVRELIVAGRRIAVITMDKTDPNNPPIIETTFVEDAGGYFGNLLLQNPALNIFARSGPVMITNLEIIPDSVGDILEITFTRHDQTNPWSSTSRINMNLSITITSKIST